MEVLRQILSKKVLREITTKKVLGQMFWILQDSPDRLLKTKINVETQGCIGSRSSTIKIQRQNINMMFSLSSDNRDIRIVCARLTGWITENWQILAKTWNVTSNFRRNVRALLNLRFSMKQPHSTAWLGDRKAEKSSRRPGKLRSSSLISPYSCKDSIAYSNI